MTILSFSFRALSFTSFILAAPLIFIPQAFANEPVPLPQISPDQISRDIERRQNPQTGAIEYFAPSFDPFEAIESIAGTVSLRSNTRVTSTDGHILRGGAVLDVNFFYTTESDDPYDVAGFEQAVFLSGEGIDATFYDNRIIECSEKISEVVYDKQYYNGASFGILAGIYRPFPRYRGHSHFGNVGFGYDWRYPSGFSGRQGFNSNNRFSRRGVTSNTRARSINSRRDRDDRNGRLIDRRNDRRNNSFRNEDRNLRGDNNSEQRREDGRRSNRDFRRERDGDNRRRLGRNGRNDNNVSNGGNPDKSDYAPRRGLNTIKGNREGGPERRRVRRNRSESAPIKSAPQGGRTIKRSESAAPQRSERAQPKPSKKSRSQPKQSQPKPSKKSRSESRRKDSSPKKSRAPRSINKATNRSFSRARSKNSKGFNFFPQGSYLASGGYRTTSVSVSQRCAREENLSIYIPRERLDAARYDGLTVLVLDRDGKDIPVYIPPNYIEGFRHTVFGQGEPLSSASSSSEGFQQNSGTYYFGPGNNLSESGDVSSGSVTYGSGANYDNESILTQERGTSVLDQQNISRQPIIYGDPGFVDGSPRWPE